MHIYIYIIIQRIHIVYIYNICTVYIYVLWNIMDIIMVSCSPKLSTEPGNHQQLAANPSGDPACTAVSALCAKSCAPSSSERVFMGRRNDL